MIYIRSIISHIYSIIYVNKKKSIDRLKLINTLDNRTPTITPTLYRFPLNENVSHWFSFTFSHLNAKPNV